MSDIDRAIERIRSWLRAPRRDLTGKQRTLRWWVDLSRHCVAELRRDRASQMAAALTYHTLFSLLPTVVLMLVALHAFVGEEERAEFKSTLVNWVLAPIQQAERVETGVRADPTRKLGEEGILNRQEFDDARQGLAVRIEEIIDKLEQVNFRSIGLVGVLLFIYGATGLLATVERSFNTVYGAAQGRSIHVRVAIYYTVITLGPIVIIGGQFLRRNFMQLVEEGGWADWATGALAVVVPLLAAWLVLVLIYVLLPNTRVRIRFAAVGALVASILLGLGNQLFTIYVLRAAVSTLYGALGLLPLFLLWMWLTWLIVLFGLALTYSLQAMQEGRFRDSFSVSREEIVIDRALLLPLAARIACAFARGDIARLAALSHELGLPPDVVERMLGVLVRHKYVRFIEDRDGGGYALARPADQISAAQILSASEALAPVYASEMGRAVWTFVERLNRALREKTAETSLADLCREESSSS